MPGKKCVNLSLENLALNCCSFFFSGSAAESQGKKSTRKAQKASKMTANLNGNKVRTPEQEIRYDCELNP